MSTLVRPPKAPSAPPPPPPPGGRTATFLLRPIARLLLPRVQEELDLMPHPLDPPQQHVAGPDPDRVLLFGNGLLNGFGVRSQQLALPGHLSRRLVERTGRGAVIDVIARRRTSIESAEQRIEGTRLWRYDSIVLLIGATDAAALLPLRRWRRAMSGLLERLLADAASTSSIVVVGIPPLRRSPLTHGLLGDRVDDHAQRLNAATEELCRQNDRLTYVARADVRAASREYQSPLGFADLAERITPVLAAHLDGTAACSGGTARELRDRPEPEDARQQALDALRMVDTQPEERFDMYARYARVQFGTRFAAVALLDHERQWNKSTMGLERESRRAASLCDETVLHDRALVIGDLRTDPRTRPELLEAGIRFFAGYPLESPDGYRVGVLCVLDTEPHPELDFDRDGLQELALRVQRELWTEPGD